jgi:pimeloyl-ACP methyl ester carboxylesterase
VSVPTVQLSDGRVLAWREFGDPNGRPVIAVHGSPDSSAIWALFHDAAARCGLRVIAPDRPGFGGSTPLPGRSIVDWVDDLDALTEHLDLKSYRVLAISGGSPYALASAWKHPNRVERLGLVSVICPLHAPEVTRGANAQVRLTFWTARRAPLLLRPMAWMMVRLVVRDPARAADRLIRMRPRADRAIIRRPEVMTVLHENLPLQFKDADSIALEMRNAARPWGFDLTTVSTPTTIWQGGLDDVHTPAMGRYLAGHLPNARLVFEQNRATFDLIADADTILHQFASEP